MARLNDTIAIVRKGLDAELQHSICTKQIDNGWLTEISRYNQETGEYTCETTYSQNQPRIIPGRIAYTTGEVGNGGLKGAVSYLNSPSGAEEKWGGDAPPKPRQGARS
jgi:hypothetical protein